jgi:hypothetical protein|tara:strand:+ start:1408 stop:1758 length:351 start_codon:yes stop_codon:yes gene_type:complete
MKKIIICVLLTVLFVSAASSQDQLSVLHFNYKWNEINNFDLRGIKNAKIQYVWLEDQPDNIRQSIKSVPVIAILGKDGKVKMQFVADISFKINATKQDVQNAINRILMGRRRASTN